MSEDRIVEAGFQQVLNAAIDDEGVAWIGGLIGSWGLHRRVAEGVTRVSESVEAVPAPDGRSVLEVERGGVTQRSLNGDVIRSGLLPWLGMAKHGRARFLDADSVIVRTDAHTLAEVDLTELR